MRAESGAYNAGFVRLAIEEGASLIPVVVMGEIDALRNLIDLPRVQVPPLFLKTPFVNSRLSCKIEFAKEKSRPASVPKADEMLQYARILPANDIYYSNSLHILIIT